MEFSSKLLENLVYNISQLTDFTNPFKSIQNVEKTVINYKKIYLGCRYFYNKLILLSYL